MKVSYPLSVKVSLWLMVNLLLLAALGLGFFVLNGGLRWDALVAGPSGARMQSLANVIAGEAAVAPSTARNDVLKRFSAAYGAEFFLFNIEDGQLAGEPVELPPAVRARMEFRLPRYGPPGGGYGPRGDGHRDRGERGEFDVTRRREPPDKVERDPSDLKSRESSAKDTRESPPGKTSGPPPGGGRGPGFMFSSTGDPQSGRFIVRAGAPTAYWVGLRVPFVSSERSRPIPAKLVVRVTSMWGLLHMLNLQSWVLAGTGVLLLSVIFWLPLVRGITRSLGQLTTATEQIAQGRFETRVPTGRRDELGQLAESVNRMAGRLDAHMTGQKRFLGDVAHELCSPLARLQMATGILADQAPKNLQVTVTDVREEVQQMSTLVNELLAFTKAGMQSRDVALRAVDLEPLVREVLTREAASGSVTVNVPPGLQVMAEPDLLARAIGNLVRNASRYAGQSGPIIVTAQRETNHVVIAIQDNGPGVPAGEIDRLGEPFFRPELARTRESGGVGLGLAIVRSSIAASGGEVRFANRQPRGFTATIRLGAA